MKRTLTKDEFKSIIKMFPDININTQIAFIAPGAICMQVPRIETDENGLRLKLERVDFVSVPGTNLMAACSTKDNLYLWRIEEV